MTTATVDFDDIAEAISPDQLARALGSKKNGTAWHCPSPDHVDKNPSFSFFRDSGRTAGRCHACGLRGTPVSIASEVWGVSKPEAAERLAGEVGLARASTLDPMAKLHNRGLRPETIERFGIEPVVSRSAWRYPVAVDGFYRLKSWNGKPKYLWHPRKPPEPGLVYNLESVSEDYALLTEGEPDVWIAAQAGIPAISFLDGATSVPDEGVQAIVDAGVRRLAVLYDHDDPGRRGAIKAARALQSAGADVWVRRLPDDMPPGSDLTDLYGIHGRDDEAFREALKNLDLVDLSTVLDEPSENGAPVEQRDEADTQTVEVDPWPDEPDPPGPAEPDPLPLDALPVGVRGHVESVAGATQTPTDLAAALSLSALATAVQGKGEVLVRRGWREPLNIYTTTVLPPASRKSPTFRHILSPLHEYERERAKDEAPIRQAAEDRREVLEQKLTTAKRNAAKGEATEGEVEAARLALEDAEVPAVTRLNAPEATPEALVKIMSEQSGRIAVLAPEGDPLRIADGRYSGHGDARLDVLKRAWTGREAIRTDRVGREGEFIPRPALTLALCLQPSVLETLRNTRSLRGEGVFGRILWAAPNPNIGSRLTGPDVPPLDDAAADRWAAVLRQLLVSEPKDVDDDGSFVPHTLPMTPEATEVLHAWEAETERELGNGGRLSGIRDWGGKLVGQTVRLAALLQLADRADRKGSGALWEPVEAWAMDAAIRLGRAFSTHALAVFAAMDMDGRTDDLRYVLKRLRDLSEGTTETELRAATRGRASIDGAEDLAELVDALEERGCVRRKPQPHEGPGRRPSPVLEIHPSLVDGHTENTVKGPERGAEPNKRYLRYANAGESEVEVPDLLDEEVG